MTKELKQQYTLRISKANKTQMVVILYEILLSYVEDAKAAHKANDTEAFKESIRKARGCIKELQSSLHTEYEIAENLLQLYLFASGQLTRALLYHRTEELECVTNIITKLCDAYRKISDQDTSGAVMQNTQTVYAGLTYGKNSLTENLADQGSSRGFRA